MRLFFSISALILAIVVIGCNEPDLKNAKSRFFVKLYGNILQEEGVDFYQTDDGGYILFGSTNSDTLSEFGNKDFYLVKTDDEGTVIWENSYGTDQDDTGVALLKNNGGYLMTGTQVNVDGERKILLWQVDLDGETVWDTSFGKPGFDYFASGLIELTDGNYMVTATTSSLVKPQEPEDKSDIVLLKFDATGGLVLEYTFPGSAIE